MAFADRRTFEGVVVLRSSSRRLLPASAQHSASAIYRLSIWQLLHWHQRIVRILIVAATSVEVGFLRIQSATTRRGASTAPLAVSTVEHFDHEIDVLVTGVGMVATAVHTSRALMQAQYGLALNLGFTYEAKGLTKVVDLGELWERATGAPIPLGGVVVRRSLATDVKTRVNRVIRRSVEYALAHAGTSLPFIRSHAQETDAGVIRRHIDLYVNNYSVRLGLEGRRAVETLFGRARAVLTTPSRSPRRCGSGNRAPSRSDHVRVVRMSFAQPHLPCRGPIAPPNRKRRTKKPKSAPRRN
jgi:Menaquinone biosynthesis